MIYIILYIYLKLYTIIFNFVAFFLFQKRVKIFNSIDILYSIEL